MTTLTEEEAKAIYDIIDELSGGNAANVFSWDGDDDMNDPKTTGLVKIFKAAEKDVPDNFTLE